jgi:predicted nuclease of predicted toxin-antitoxin system
VKLRFQADADLKRAIVAGLQRYSKDLDFQTAESIPLEGLDDLLVLASAADQNRVLVSHDQNTMELHFRRFVREQSSPGLILIPQRIPIGAAIET